MLEDLKKFREEVIKNGNIYPNDCQAFGFINFKPYAKFKDNNYEYHICKDKYGNKAGYLDMEDDAFFDLTYEYRELLNKDLSVDLIKKIEEAIKFKMSCMWICSYDDFMTEYIKQPTILDFDQIEIKINRVGIMFEYYYNGDLLERYNSFQIMQYDLIKNNKMNEFEKNFILGNIEVTFIRNNEKILTFQQADNDEIDFVINNCVRPLPRKKDNDPCKNFDIIYDINMDVLNRKEDNKEFDLRNKLILFNDYESNDKKLFNMIGRDKSVFCINIEQLVREFYKQGYTNIKVDKNNADDEEIITINADLVNKLDNVKYVK